MAGEPDDVDAMVEPVVPSRHRWLFTLNRSGLPIVEVPLADLDDLARAGRLPLARGI